MSPPNEPLRQDLLQGVWAQVRESVSAVQSGGLSWTYANLFICFCLHADLPFCGSVFLFKDNLRWWVHRSRGSPLAHETLLLPGMRDGPGGAEVHHEGWPPLLLRLLRVSLRGVLWNVWGAYWWVWLPPTSCLPCHTAAAVGDYPPSCSFVNAGENWGIIYTYRSTRHVSDCQMNRLFWLFIAANTELILGTLS